MGLKNWYGLLSGRPMDGDHNNSGTRLAENKVIAPLWYDLVIERDSDLVAESINLGQPAIQMRRSAFKKSIDDLTVRAGKILATADLASLNFVWTRGLMLSDC